MRDNRNHFDHPADYSCLSCTADWGYLGEGRPEPECPDCGSPAVTPIGALTHEGTHDVQVEDGLEAEFKRSIATDETGREFRFLFSLEEDPRVANLERLVVKIGGAYVSVDLSTRELSPRRIGLPDIRAQVRIAVGHRAVRIPGHQGVL